VINCLRILKFSFYGFIAVFCLFISFGLDAATEVVHKSGMDRNAMHDWCSAQGYECGNHWSNDYASGIMFVNHSYVASRGSTNLSDNMLYTIGVGSNGLSHCEFFYGASGFICEIRKKLAFSYGVSTSCPNNGWYDYDTDMAHPVGGVDSLLCAPTGDTDWCADGTQCNTNPTCDAGDFGSSCAVECPNSDWGSGLFVGSGSTCAGSFDVGGSGIITYEKSDYGCVNGDGISICDATGFTNGQSGSGSNGGNTPDDQLTAFCERMFWDHPECLGFSPVPDEVCQNGVASVGGDCSDDLLNGFQWTNNSCAVGESPFFDTSNGSYICVPQTVQQAPNNPPNALFIGGTVQGGGGNNGDGDFDDSGIIEALESVDDSVDGVRDAVEDGNGLLEEIRDNTAKGTASGGSTCSAAPVCDGDPIQCAQLNQIWKLRCDDDSAEFSGLCSSPFLCEGNAFECAREQAAYNQVCPTYEDNPDDARNNAYDTAVVDLAASMGSLGISADNVGDMTAQRTADGFELESEVDLEELVNGLDDYTSAAGECPADISLELGQFGSLVIPISDWCGILYFLGVLVRISATYAATRMIYLALVGV
jgi:hypothetical protein